MLYRVMNTVISLKKLADRDLIAEVKRLAKVERASTAALGEMDARRLYLGEGCSSLFVYCTQVLHLSEHAAYGRIEAARAIRRFPDILECLEGGELTFTAVSLLRPHLTESNCGELLEAATHKSKRDVERLVAEIAPRPDAPATVRKLPVRVASASERAIHEAAPKATTTAAGLDGPTAVGNSSPAPARASEIALETAARGAALVSASVPSTPLVKPLAPERYKVQFTIGQKMHDKLRRAQDLLRRGTQWRSSRDL
jgi:hypothetical protein